jgi:hypothetical protein
MAKAPASPSDKSHASAKAITVDRHGIVVGADPRSVERARALLDSIARRKQRIAEDFYGLGEELRELRDKKLYAKVYGYSSFDVFLEERAVYSPTQARKLIAVVRGMSKARALKLGIEKAYAAVALAKATEAKDSADEIFEKGHKVCGKRPSEASIDDFEAEARRAREMRKSKRSSKIVTSAERERKKRRSAGVKVLRAALKSAGIKGTLDERRDGVVLIVPWKSVERLC